MDEIRAEGQGRYGFVVAAGPFSAREVLRTGAGISGGGDQARHHAKPAEGCRPMRFARRKQRQWPKRGTAGGENMHRGRASDLGYFRGWVMFHRSAALH